MEKCKYWEEVAFFEADAEIGPITHEQVHQYSPCRICDECLMASLSYDVLDILHSKVFRPYESEPVFIIITWSTNRVDDRGQTIIGYRFFQMEDDIIETIFEGEDFAGSPMHADDSEETLRALMGVLTLRPGDTDRDYFKNYTAEQLNFCEKHAEVLCCDPWEK